MGKYARWRGADNNAWAYLMVAAPMSRDLHRVIWAWQCPEGGAGWAWQCSESGAPERGAG